jgi:hypothetical protein
MGDYDMKPAEKIERFIRHISFRASRAMDEDLWANIARAGDGRTQELVPDRRDIRRFIMRMSTTRIAIAALVCIGVGAVTAVGVNIGRIYYWGRTDDGTGHIFRSEGGQGALGEGFITMDANGVTDVEQTRRDLEEMKILSQQGKKELLRVEETMMAGTVEMRMHEYKYELSDGRTKDMREGVKWGGGFHDKERWQEWRQLKEAGPGEDLGTYEETVEDRVVSFKRERYVLSDGTEIIWSVGTPKDGQ